MSYNKKSYITTETSSTAGSHTSIAAGTLYVTPNTTDHIINTGVQHSQTPLTMTIDEMLEKLTNIEKLLKLVDIDAVLAEKYPELTEAYDEYERLRDKLLIVEAIKKDIDDDGYCGDSC